MNKCQIERFVNALIMTGMAREEPAVKSALMAVPEKRHMVLAVEWARKAKIVAVEEKATQAARMFAMYEAFVSLGMTSDGMEDALLYWRRVENRRNITPEAKGGEMLRRAGIRLGRVPQQQPR